MKKYLICFFLLSLFAQVKAQNLQGKIIDQITGNGISFVSVGIVGTNKATISNENGDFIIKVDTYPVVIRCSHVSYLLNELNLLSNTEKLIIQLKPALINLNEVTIDPYKGQRLLKDALEKAAIYSNTTFYANAFYRQLTTTNDKPSQIYELFYDLQWNTKRVQGWIAKQSRFAEQTLPTPFYMDNQSYLTFLYTGYLFPERGGKFVSLSSLADYEIVIEKYIEQADQKIAVVSCKFKKAKKSLYYINSTYYIGVDDFKIYRLENNVFNLSIKFTEASPKFPPILTTIATFSGNEHPFPILESVYTKLYLSLSIKGQTLNTNISSLLTVFKIDDELKTQQYEALDRTTKDKKVIESVTYNANFWKNNPIVKQTTLEDSFSKMMESKLAFGTMINP